jgi:L-rhamnose-H+ transport protein
MLPSKWIKGWEWENYWLIFALTAYLVAPWILAALTIPHLLEVYRGVSLRSFIVLAFCGLGWGLGALTFGLGVDAIGLALGLPIILGVAATAGTLVPLLIDPPLSFSFDHAALTGLGLALMLVGVGVCSFAGRWKESSAREDRGRSYRRGVLICIASGLLSACGNLGFAFGGEISNRARELGAADHLAPNALWSLLTIPLLLCNAGYAGWLLERKGTAVHFHKEGFAWRALLGVVMGVMWIAGMSLYGAGARKLGALGPSLGWAILLSSMVLVSNALGLLTGEWAAAPAGARRRLAQGLSILLIAIAVLAWGNYARGG